MTTLTEHDGRDVEQASVRITHTGDGLSDAMTIEPREFHNGDDVYVVLATTCSRVSYETLKDSPDAAERRVHTLRATTGTVVDRELVESILDAHRLAVERAAGVQRLPLEHDDPDDA